jgi:hypothetical protein
VDTKQLRLKRPIYDKFDTAIPSPIQSKPGKIPGMDQDDENGIVFGANQRDGSYWPMSLTGHELIEKLFGDDVGVPIRSVTLKAKTTDGKTVRVTFSNDESVTVRAAIE